MTVALTVAKEYYGNNIHEVTVFVTVTDSDDAEEIENRSAVRINTPGIAQSFLARFD